MEDLVTWRDDCRPAFAGKRVLVTGDTGFKGAWLCEWLLMLGADVAGFAHPPEAPSHFDLLELRSRIAHADGELRDAAAVSAALERYSPDIVFHLGAQAIVRDSYNDPVETFATNVMGTAHVLEAVRRTPSVRAAVIVTSDKCYENHEWVWAYRESDELGGHDPYSASKAGAEIVTSSFRRSFFASRRPTLGVATTRAGNVIGGGDWARDRLVPDCARTLLRGEALTLRNPRAVRPWQHVLEPLGGYLRLAACLLRDPARFSKAYNFGPETSEAMDVEAVARRMQTELQSGEIRVAPDPNAPHEASLLRLSCERAHVELRHRPTLSTEEAIAWTARWYRAWRDEPASVADFTRQQLREFEARLSENEART